MNCHPDKPEVIRQPAHLGSFDQFQGTQGSDIMADQTRRANQGGTPSGAHGATTTGAFGDTGDEPPEAATAGPETTGSVPAPGDIRSAPSGTPSGAHGATTTGAFGDTGDDPPEAATAGPETTGSGLQQGSNRDASGETGGPQRDESGRPG